MGLRREETSRSPTLGPRRQSRTRISIYSTTISARLPANDLVEPDALKSGGDVTLKPLLQRLIAFAVGLIVCVHALAQNYTGTFTTTHPQGGTVTLTLRYDGPKQVRGTLTGDSTTFEVGGEVTPEGLMGAVTSPQGSLCMMAQYEGANLPERLGRRRVLGRTTSPLEGDGRPAASIAGRRELAAAAAADHAELERLADRQVRRQGIHGLPLGQPQRSQVSGQVEGMGGLAGAVHAQRMQRSACAFQ